LQAEFGEQIRFTFRHLPVITPQSAEAAQCAAEQDAFIWQYHDYLYEQVAPGRLSPAELKQYAATLGLDSQAFNSCLDSGRYEAYVEQDMQDGFDLGARGTPSFFVNGQPANLFSYESAVVTIRQHLP
jgi:protein-disulfide isomerase